MYLRSTLSLVLIYTTFQLTVAGLVFPPDLEERLNNLAKFLSEDEAKKLNPETGLYAVLNSEAIPNKYMFWIRGKNDVNLLCRGDQNHGVWYTYNTIISQGNTTVVKDLGAPYPVTSSSGLEFTIVFNDVLPICLYLYNQTITREKSDAIIGRSSNLVPFISTNETLTHKPWEPPIISTLTTTATSTPEISPTAPKRTGTYTNETSTYKPREPPIIPWPTTITTPITPKRTAVHSNQTSTHNPWEPPIISGPTIATETVPETITTPTTLTRRVIYTNQTSTHNPWEPPIISGPITTTRTIPETITTPITPNKGVIDTNETSTPNPWELLLISSPTTTTTSAPEITTTPTTPKRPVVHTNDTSIHKPREPSIISRPTATSNIWHPPPGVGSTTTTDQHLTTPSNVPFCKPDVPNSIIFEHYTDHSDQQGPDAPYSISLENCKCTCPNVNKIPRSVLKGKTFELL